MKKSNIIALIVLVCCSYVVISFGVYRFRHPEMTETELFLGVCDALLWRD